MTVARLQQEAITSGLLDIHWVSSGVAVLLAVALTVGVEVAGQLAH